MPAKPSKLQLTSVGAPLTPLPLSPSVFLRPTSVSQGLGKHLQLHRRAIKNLAQYRRGFALQKDQCLRNRQREDLRLLRRIFSGSDLVVSLAFGGGHDRLERNVVIDCF